MNYSFYVYEYFSISCQFYEFFYSMFCPIHEVKILNWEKNFVKLCIIKTSTVFIFEFLDKNNLILKATTKGQTVNKVK